MLDDGRWDELDNHERAMWISEYGGRSVVSPELMVLVDSEEETGRLSIGRGARHSG